MICALHARVCRFQSSAHSCCVGVRGVTVPAPAVGRASAACGMRPRARSHDAAASTLPPQAVSASAASLRVQPRMTSVATWTSPAPSRTAGPGAACLEDGGGAMLAPEECREGSAAGAKGRG